MIFQNGVKMFSSAQFKMAFEYVVQRTLKNMLTFWCSCFEKLILTSTVRKKVVFRDYFV